MIRASSRDLERWATRIVVIAALALGLLLYPDGILRVGVLLSSVPPEVLTLALGGSAGGAIVLVVLHRRPRVRRAWMTAAKRMIDICVAALGLVVLSPLLACVATIIRVREGPPVLLRQEHLGLHARPFRKLKFRTLRSDAVDDPREMSARFEAMEGFAFKVGEDPRVTSTGRWLRRTGLDELPELWNVLRGDMSLIGPRARLPYEEPLDPEVMRQLSMRPGVTGLWRLGLADGHDFDGWVALDLEYVDRWSLLLDLRILLHSERTPRRAAAGHRKEP